jgi:flavin reductase (DIM6/NTAB) family NADH-FMN oxidoreductase RutF
MGSPYLDLVSPVGLVLTEWKGKRNAMTVSFFSEVAHHPTALWISVKQTSYTHELVQESGRFTLIVLDDKQAHLARACGSVSGRTTDKCAGLQLYYGSMDQLYMQDAFASAACRVRSTHSVGDHTLFIADILAGEFESRRSIHRHLLTTDLI